MLSLWLLWWLSKPFFVWYRLKVRNNWLFVTNLLPWDKTKPPGKSFLFPKQFDHRPHVHLCVLPHHVQDLFWWAVDGYSSIVWTYFGGVLMDITILFGPTYFGGVLVDISMLFGLWYWSNAFLINMMITKVKILWGRKKLFCDIGHVK